MTDPFEDLFTAARTQATRQIRPPGAEAARRTVRRRRTTTTAVAAGAAVLVVFGASTLLSRERSTSPTPAATPGVPTSLPEIARRKVAAANPGTAAVEAAGPVTAGYTRHSADYLGNLKLSVACAGTGRITLIVAAIPSKKTSATAPIERARTTAECGTDPVPSEVTFSTKGTNDLVFRLSDEGDAVGHAGFAYRLTTDTGVPMKPDDPRADPEKVLDLKGKDVRVAGSGWVPPIGLHFVEQPGVASGDYHLAFACAGTGVATIQVRSGGRAVASHDVPCQWPPRQVELAVGAADPSVTTWLAFRTSNGMTAPARIGWAWVRD